MSFDAATAIINGLVSRPAVPPDSTPLVVSDTELLLKFHRAEEDAAEGLMSSVYIARIRDLGDECPEELKERRRRLLRMLEYNRVDHDLTNVIIKYEAWKNPSPRGLEKLLSLEARYPELASKFERLRKLMGPKLVKAVMDGSYDPDAGKPKPKCRLIKPAYIG